MSNQDLVRREEISKAIDRTFECIRLLKKEDHNSPALDQDDFQKVINDPIFRARLISFWKSNAPIIVVIQTPMSLSDLRDQYGDGEDGFDLVHRYSNEAPRLREKEWIESSFTSELLDSGVYKIILGTTKEVLTSEDWVTVHQVALAKACLEYRDETDEDLLPNSWVKTSSNVYLRSSKGITWSKGVVGGNISKAFMQKIA